MKAWPQALRGRGNLPLLLALLLLALAAWPPQIRMQRPVFTWQVNFDITQSMNVADVELRGAAVSRLNLARAAMREVLAALPCGSKVGWSVFADYRALVVLVPVEVCSHYEELLAGLERIDARMRWANASNIGKGVTWSVRGAKSVGQSANFVFFTDGQEAPPVRSNDIPPMVDITPGEVQGWVVGVGGDQPAPIPKTGPNGQDAGFWKPQDVIQGSAIGSPLNSEHLSELREDYLRTLAKLVGVSYLRLSSPGALKAAMLDKRFAQMQVAQVDLRWIPALLALLLLAWRFAPDVALWRGRRHGADRLGLRRFFGPRQGGSQAARVGGVAEHQRVLHRP